MIKTGQLAADVPVVGWQGKKHQPFRLLRLDEVRGKKPRDGHDPGVPHRIGFHALLLVAEGTFDHWIDFQTHRFKKNQLIYIAPNQIHRFLGHKKNQRVWALIFQPEIFPAGLSEMHGGQSPWSILSYLWPCVTKLQPKETALMVEQFEFLRKLEGVSPEADLNSANHFVRGIISFAYEACIRNHKTPLDTNVDARFLEFVELVEEFFVSRRDVKWYAQQIDCSQRTLNRACQVTTGDTAKMILARRVVIEAKRLLAQSSESVSAVGEKLGFGATTNFVRYFRNETGTTPQQFRTQQSSG